MPDDHQNYDEPQCYVALIGQPNAGKSTLLNRLIGQKLSIVTQKPQTTRHRILGLVSAPAYQIILYDTPGVLSKSMHKLDDLMMQAVRTATVNADAVVLVIDITQAPQEVSKLLLEGMESAVVQKKPTLIVLNKKDSLKPGEVAKKLKWYQDAVAADGHSVIALSAKRGDGVDGLLAWMLDNIPQGPAYYPKDVVSELPERFFVAEIVREKILLQYSQEVPYASQVTVRAFREREKAKDYISLDIMVERDSQKAILLGKEGKQLKALATASRMDIEEFLGREVFLEIRVKVKEKWRQDETLLKEYGLDVRKRGSCTVVKRQRPSVTQSPAAAGTRRSPRPVLLQPSPPVSRATNDEPSSSATRPMPALPKVKIPSFPEQTRPQGPPKRNADADAPSPRHRMTKRVRHAYTAKEKLHWLKLQESQPDLSNRALAKLAKVQPY
ncbi:unnamed protein product [Closterium sp. NIES-64]|nr:unnamed protein product [Closterium sp. NIES-64]